MKKNLSPPPPSIQSFVDDCKINKKENVSENIFTGNPQSTHSTSHLLAFDWTAREKNSRNFSRFDSSEKWQWRWFWMWRNSLISQVTSTHTRSAIKKLHWTFPFPTNNDDFFVSSIKCDDGKVPSTFALAQELFMAIFRDIF